MKCNEDCLNCIYDDCILDRSEKTEEQKAHTRELVRKRYWKCKENGICVYCQKKPATHGIYCEGCRTYMSEFRKRRNLKRKGVNACQG